MVLGMKLEDAVHMAVRKTGHYPISAFEYSGEFYVYLTPFSDYDPSNDYANYCCVVDASGVGEPIGVMDPVFDHLGDPGFALASKKAVSFLGKSEASQPKG